jgi:uncharacterized protein (DUF1697 family)
MTVCIAFLRGINVGRAKRIAMADLCKLFEELGYKNVSILLNSGNVVFEVSHPNTNKIISAIEVAIQSTFGFPVSVFVITALELNNIIHANPLGGIASDPSRHLVAFVSQSSVLAKAKMLLAESWAPEAIAIGPKTAYLWCANGIIESKLMKAFARLAGDAATTRNWATVLKLQVIAGGSKNAIRSPGRTGP